MIKQSELKKNIISMKKNINEMNSIYNEVDKIRDDMEKTMVLSQIDSLGKSLKITNEKLGNDLKGISLVSPLKSSVKDVPHLPVIDERHVTPQKKIEPRKISPKVQSRGITQLERQIIKRLKKKEIKVEVKKEIKASNYVGVANRFFSGVSKSLVKKDIFRNLRRNLIKANMRFLARSYISTILFNTLISFIASIFIFIFFLFFNFGAQFPFITMVKGGLIARIGSIFWILFVIPFVTFMISYLYPLMEKKTIEMKINHELPFATIHMASISESLVEPSNIFKIVISTREYPTIEKEFTKLLNEINIFGHDLVTALRNSAFNCPSRKLSELLDGLATTITSGGDLAEFFDKRAQTLLFEHKLDKEKQTKSAETFMDIYISVVIAAPMILMLLLIMMRVSGLGIALSTTMISIIMVLGVSVVNVGFLTFLQLKKQA